MMSVNRWRGQESDAEIAFIPKSGAFLIFKKQLRG
jgi:hypothetical protein